MTVKVLVLDINYHCHVSGALARVNSVIPKQASFKKWLICKITSVNVKIFIWNSDDNDSIAECFSVL